MKESNVIFKIESGPRINSSETRYYVTFCDGRQSTVVAANEEMAAHMCSSYCPRPCPVD